MRERADGGGRGGHFGLLAGELAPDLSTRARLEVSATAEVRAIPNHFSDDLFHISRDISVRFCALFCNRTRGYCAEKPIRAKKSAFSFFPWRYLSKGA
jgi:hypothetical protein